MPVPPVRAHDQRDAGDVRWTSSPRSPGRRGPWRPPGRRPPGRRSGSRSPRCASAVATEVSATASREALADQQPATSPWPAADRRPVRSLRVPLCTCTAILSLGGRRIGDRLGAGGLAFWASLPSSGDVLAHQTNSCSASSALGTTRLGARGTRFGIVVIVMRSVGTFLQLARQVVQLVDGVQAVVDGERLRWPPRRGCVSLSGVGQLGALAQLADHRVHVHVLGLGAGDVGVVLEAVAGAQPLQGLLALDGRARPSSASGRSPCRRRCASRRWRPRRPGRRRSRPPSTPHPAKSIIMKWSMWMPVSFSQVATVQPGPPRPSDSLVMPSVRRRVALARLRVRALGDVQQRVARHAHHRHVAAVGRDVQQHLDVRERRAAEGRPWRRRASGSPWCRGRPSRSAGCSAGSGPPRWPWCSAARSLASPMFRSSFLMLRVEVPVVEVSGARPSRGSAPPATVADQRSIGACRAGVPRSRLLRPSCPSGPPRRRRRPDASLVAASFPLGATTSCPAGRPDNAPAPHAAPAPFPCPSHAVHLHTGARPASSQTHDRRPERLPTWRTRPCRPGLLYRRPAPSPAAVSGTPAPLKSLPRVSVIAGSPCGVLTLLPGFSADAGQAHHRRRACGPGRPGSGAYSRVVFASVRGRVAARCSDFGTPSSFCSQVSVSCAQPARPAAVEDLAPGHRRRRPWCP